MKKREGIVYSTDPDFVYDAAQSAQNITLPPEQQLLYVWLDSRRRKGKTVTLIRGFVGNVNDLDQLATDLKKLCGTGGSVKDGEIIIQGSFREKVMDFLAGMGYRTKRAGG